MKSIVLFATILRIILISAIISFTIIANAQSVAVNTTGTSADASAMLDVSSSSKGFLAPRMSTVQRTGIPSPANGLMVFDTDTKSYWFFSTTWKEITNGGGGIFSLPYSGIFSDPTKIFSINNTNPGNGATAIYGKSGNDGSGIGLATTVGVWGDNSDGAGLVGTSANGVGTYGFSMQNHGIYGYTGGSSFAGVYGLNQNNGIGVFGQTGTGIGVYGKASGLTGKAGVFEITSINNNDTVMKLLNAGAGVGLFSKTTTGIAGNFYKDGTGIVPTVKIENAGNESRALEVVQSNPDSWSTVAHIKQMGKGEGLLVSAGNTNTSTAGWFSHSGEGTGIYVTMNNTQNTNPAVNIDYYGKSPGIKVDVHNGVAGYFTNLNSSSTKAVLMLVQHGTGSLAEFKGNYNNNLIRFDNNGKGFFNGGTQTGGADMAEAFDVNGDRDEYEPGDVLMISIDKDRCVERSNKPYSNLVVGVFATKPGVLMTEENIETDISDKVPMGVLGVIPTKVCLEGGEIKRGDMLVTSSITGVAMKADINKVEPGQVIGKALENYSGNGIGKIRVLVNVK